MNRLRRVALEILRLTFARDTLEAPHPAAAAAAARRGPNRLLRAIFAPEALPLDPPAPAPARRPVLRWLLAPEPLPRDPEPAPRPRARRLAALFAPEKLDDPR